MLAISPVRLAAARAAVRTVTDKEVQDIIHNEFRRRDEARGRREHTTSFGSAQPRCEDPGCNAFKRALNAVCPACGLDPVFQGRG